MQHLHGTTAVFLFALGIVAAACSAAGTGNEPFEGKGVSGEKPADTSVPANDDDGQAPVWQGQGGNDEQGTSGCGTNPEEDFDGDGYSINDGDCNDCDPYVNPGALDLAGSGQDEDCDGIIDNEPADCDTGFGIDDANPMNAARAMGLCRIANASATGKGRTWGVLSAKYVKADGTPGMNPLSHGILPKFGVASVQQGKSMLALSSGTARDSSQPGFTFPFGADMGTKGDPPTGYPKESSSCPGVKTGKCKDPAALELEIRVPTNAKSFSFALNFYTFEYPEYICSEFNDYYVTIMDPKPPELPDGNISFDQDGNPVSVNNTLLQVCNPGKAGGKQFPCPLGPALLEGTGFEDHAATGWLQTLAPVEPGSVITLRFAIWDSGDHILDSTVLIDDFQWHAEPAGEPETTPIEFPK
jgi:hypothetical protein